MITGPILKRSRLSKKLSQEAVGKLINKSRSYIGQVEQGRRFLKEDEKLILQEFFGIPEEARENIPVFIKSVLIPVLNGLQPKTLLTQMLQSTEELGETAKNINLLTGLSAKRKPVPENIVELTSEEILDTMQSLVGCLYVLERDHGYAILTGWERHIRKMRERGFLLE